LVVASAFLEDDPSLDREERHVGLSRRVLYRFSFFGMSGVAEGTTSESKTRPFF